MADIAICMNLANEVAPVFITLPDKKTGNQEEIFRCYCLIKNASWNTVFLRGFTPFPALLF